MKLVLVDDELAILESLKAALKPTGYECEFFQNVPAALDAFRNGQYDVMVTDFMMPGMNGIELLKAVRAAKPGAYVIIFTGYADIDNAIAAVNNGAYAFFRKPLDFRAFVQALRRIEEELNGKKQKEIDINCFLSEYAKLQSTFDSLQEVVNRLRSAE